MVQLGCDPPLELWIIDSASAEATMAPVTMTSKPESSPRRAT
jgi:hypothetical protein